MSVLDEILKEWLPVRRARWTAATALLAASAAFGFPDALEKLDVSLTAPTRLLIRISAPLAVALLGALLVIAILLRHIHSLMPGNVNHRPPDLLFDAANPLPFVLALIAKYHSQEIPATPRKIADDLGMDPEVTLAFMWKYHNEQYFTFRNDGKRPDLDTGFFLSSKAWDVIKVVEA